MSTVCFSLLLVKLGLAVLFSVPASADLSNDLYRHLLADYDPSLIPICKEGRNVTVQMDMALRQILKLDERDQLLTTNVWIRTSWYDCRLTWDPAAYGDQGDIVMPFHELWVPDFALVDSAAEEIMFPGFGDYWLRVDNAGLVSYNFPSVLKSVCRVGVRAFPFDKQECPLMFNSWAHHGFEIDLVSKNPTGDVDNYVHNPEWIITDLPIKRHVAIYGCCPQPYPDITFYVVMQRRPHFYMLTILFPTILTSAVAALSFMLPVECGEKAELQITSLLSLAVFLLVVTDFLPPSSESVPIIGIYFASSMVLVSFSLMQSVVVINSFYRGTNNRRVPKWAKKVFVEYLGSYLFLHSNCVGIKDSFHEITASPNRHQNDDDAVSEDVDHTGKTSSRDDTHYNTDSSLQDHTKYSDESSPQDDTNHNLEECGDKCHKCNTTAICLKGKTRQLASISSYMTHDADAREQIFSEWRDIANVLDRLCLVLYLVILLITTLVFLGEALS